ncbi:hypothetical protein HUU05_00335 [candidate division KSB1 bacterium]|nr:hypothetical protein [candidate division KSB1 bacterium]
MKGNEAIFKTTSALLLRAPLEPGPVTGAVHKLVRESMPMLLDDRVLAEDLAAAAHLISSEEVVRRAEEVVGEL